MNVLGNLLDDGIIHRLATDYVKNIDKFFLCYRHIEVTRAAKSQYP